MKKNKTEKDFKNWIIKQIEFYRNIIGIELREIELERATKPNSYLLMGCTYPYLDSTIYYSQSAYRDWVKGELKKDRILHELIHLITDPLYSKAMQRFASNTEIEDEREKLTDTISNIIRKLT